MAASAAVAEAQAKQMRRAKRSMVSPMSTTSTTNPRHRVMGIDIDKQALDEQVREKQAMKMLEKERDDYYAQQALDNDKYGKYLDHEERKMRLEREVDTDTFRKTMQQPTMRREWDLNDPKRVTKDQPPRTGGDDDHCPPSSIQQFEGEDPDYRNRKAAQATQMSRWMQQQISEKNYRKNLEDRVNKLNHDRTEQVSHKAWVCEKAIAARRAAQAKATADFNVALAEQKQKEKLADKFHETHCNLQEIQNMLDSDLLNERRDPRVDEFGIRIPKDRVKGLTHDDKHHILETQEVQRQQLMQKRDEDKVSARREAFQEKEELRMAEALERQRNRDRRAAAVELGRERKQQAMDATARRAELDALYRNEISDKFYEHSGRTYA